MADRLRRAIYHEKASISWIHALNSLLQQPLFTATDLASIAQNLDAMEQSYDENHRGRSTNMDDSGFFSIQVLENALQVWGLTLVRWRSQEMRPYLDKPYTQLAFILNLELHWFTLRRFGPAEADVTRDPGEGHWFNLNSFLEEPEWVSKTYLGMVLQQAETEGYSVFVVSQIDPMAPLALTRTTADEIAASIPDITSGGRHLSTSRTASKASTSAANDWGVSGAEDEDMELQAALFASVMGESTQSSTALEPARPAPRQGTSDEWDINTSSFFGSSRMASSAAESSVEASARRAREELARFQEEQMRALDERTDSDDMIASVLGRRRNVASETIAAEPRTRQRRQQQDEEEEEMIRRAIEASKREAQENGQGDDSEEEPMSFDDDENAYDEEHEEREQLERLMQERRKRQREQEEQERIRRGFVDAEDDFGHFGANAEHLVNRTYDDEDAELQAALKASLEGGTESLAIPSPPKPVRAPTQQESKETPAASASQTAPRKPDSDEEDSDSDDEPETEQEAPPKPLTAEELRKARLARFGGA
ncbi:hypothetical protein PIIN_00033 [Serendipita indica DSM 11827]|uniref:ubiquitinyl hydrolase 1 n=1 Tax=Serendipita indica (strain DSM 11827) TaxID=1109443 RepID=G4T4V0_SERID|nr:hypothetical protein PIIN_00033 [Serendipita indica DSM 11827]